MTQPFLDLSSDRAAALLDAALERKHAQRLMDAALPLLARLDPEARLFGEHVVEELARLSAQLDALAQAQQAAALSRAERLRLDPLRAIPAARQAAAAAPEPAAEDGPVAIEAGDASFVGFGWWPVERTEGGSLRWAGAHRCATVLLPALGGGDLSLSLSVRAPFGVPLDIAQHDLFLDGAPLTFATVSNDGVTGVFEARITLPERPAGAKLTLLWHGPRQEDPATGPRRDTRALGLGLAWLRLERAG